MKSYIVTLSLVLVFFSCKKTESTDQNNVGQNSLFPDAFILTFSEGSNYVYLYTNGSTMYRKSIPKTYDLSLLAKEEDCKFFIQKGTCEFGPPDCYTIRLDKNRKIWAGVGPSSNGQETFMYALNTSSSDPGDGYRFKIHQMPKEEGAPTIVIESKEKPGWYLSASGPSSQFAQNQVTFEQKSNIANAKRWQCRN